MRRFVVKACFVFVVFIGLLEIYFAVVPGAKYSLGPQNWLKTVEINNRSKTTIKSDTLFVGCSVAGQILNGSKENVLTTNGSTYPAGNYFLIKNVLEKNKHVEHVIYLSVPNVIGHSLARKNTCNNFLKPFLNVQNFSEIMSDEATREVLLKNKLLPFYVFNTFKLGQFDDYDYTSDSIYPDSLENKWQLSDFLSEESFYWIEKINELCMAEGVQFHLVSPPVPKSNSIKYADWTNLRDGVKRTELQDLFTQYFNSIIYSEDSYLMDEFHWNEAYLEKNKGTLLEKILLKANNRGLN